MLYVLVLFPVQYAKECDKVNTYHSVYISKSLNAFQANVLAAIQAMFNHRYSLQRFQFQYSRTVVSWP